MPEHKEGSSGEFEKRFYFIVDGKYSEYKLSPSQKLMYERWNELYGCAKEEL